MPEEYLLAIPVFNEERYVNRVIDEAKQYSRHILVIDDGSHPPADRFADGDFGRPSRPLSCK